jgi:hypothetical protein
MFEKPLFIFAVCFFAPTETNRAARQESLQYTRPVQYMPVEHQDLDIKKQ